MNVEQIYNKFRELGSARSKEGREFKATLTNTEYTAYVKYRDNQRQKKHEATHKEENNKRRREHIKEIRSQQKIDIKRAEALDIVSSILNDIINAVPNLKLVDGEVKKKRGRRVGWRKPK